MTASINVFKLPQVVNLTLAPTTGANLMNYSATRSDFKVMKGITTEIHFFIKNTDREPVAFGDGDTLEIVITDQKRTRELLVKTLVLDNAARSIWKLSLSKHEVADWPLDTLSYGLVVNRAVGDRVMLYLDRGYGAYSELLVVSGPYPDARIPDEFDVANFIERDGLFYSAAIPASVDPTFPQTAFSAAFYAEDFKGEITIQATLDEQPDAEDEMWFEATKTTLESVTSGTHALHAIGAYNWIRFVVRPVEGDISRVVLQR